MIIAANRKSHRKLSSAVVDTEHLAHEAIARHSHFRGRADEFTFIQHGDRLIVRGRVPTFYLKHVLQKVLTRLDGVRVVDNQVDVVSCNGLSSVP